MARTLQKEVSKFYHIEDVDCDIEVVETTRINVLDYIDQIIDNIKWNNEGGCADCSDMYGVILYKDGTYDFINNDDYDGKRKVRRIGIEAAMYEDGYGTYVFGNYEVNDCGVVTI